MRTFGFEFPVAATAKKATALVFAADGTGTVTRKRQAGNRIVDRVITVSGVIATRRCERVESSKGVKFEGVTSKGRSSTVDLNIPDDFAGSMYVTADLGEKCAVVSKTEVEVPKNG